MCIHTQTTNKSDVNNTIRNKMCLYKISMKKDKFMQCLKILSKINEMTEGKVSNGSKVLDLSYISKSMQ